MFQEGVVGAGQWTELPATLEVTPAQLGARAERRLAQVLRQLEMRLGEIESLQQELGAARQELDVARRENKVLAQRLHNAEREHDALLRTKSMRLLRVPRAVYGRVKGLAR
jgi:hypothetical protein